MDSADVPSAAFVTLSRPGCDFREEFRLSDATNRLRVLFVDDEAMIREAHRELMKKVHPDMPGGSDELARQVQEARDCLLPK